jgi:hypothetical protein
MVPFTPKWDTSSFVVTPTPAVGSRYDRRRVHHIEGLLRRHPEQWELERGKDTPLKDGYF